MLANASFGSNVSAEVAQSRSWLYEKASNTWQLDQRCQLALKEHTPLYDGKNELALDRVLVVVHLKLEEFFSLRLR